MRQQKQRLRNWIVTHLLGVVLYGLSLMKRGDAWASKRSSSLQCVPLLPREGLTAGAALREIVCADGRHSWMPPCTAALPLSSPAPVLASQAVPDVGIAL